MSARALPLTGRSALLAARLGYGADNMRVRLKREQLLDLIARSNLSQNHWAMKLGLSRGHWSDIVNGKHPYPSPKTRERMLEVLRVDFDDLFETESGGWSDQKFHAAISDRYLIDRELGHGGMGTVYLARDVKLGRQVAIKVVSPEAVSGIGIRQFLKEIRNTARLEHHHILPLHDGGEAAGYPYYVMPYIRDGSLRDLLDRKQRLSVDETLRITRGVAAALEYAHEHRIVHCDVKPANVLLSGDHALVADFGIARAIHTEAFEWGKPPAMDSSAGTPAYVSPEQASGERHLGARSDIYSLACMVFEMLSGRPPFVGTTTLAIVSQRFTSEVPDLGTFVSGIPSRVTRAVRRGMSLELERRHASPTEFVEALERGVAHVSPVRERLSLVGPRLSALTRRFLGDTAKAPRTRAQYPLLTRGRQMLGSIKQDCIYALRNLSRTPLFTTVVVLTLAFGIAATALVFSLMNPYFIRPLPFGEPDRLVQLGQVDDALGWGRMRFSLPQLADYRERTGAFSDLGAYYYGSRNLTGVEGPERILVGYVTGNMFSLLQVTPLLGRALLPEESEPTAGEVTVLDHGLWQRRYGADPQIVGRSVTVDGVSRTVVGVMPRDFVFPFGGIDLWLPIRMNPEEDPRGHMGSIIVGRLTDGWSPELAREELNAIQRNLAEVYPEEDGRYSGISVLPIRQALNFVWDIFRIMFTLLMVSVAFALIIVCANVASLILARGTARKGEVAVRTALGAGRGRLIRQLLTESVMLAAAGGILGLVVTQWGSKTVGPLIPEDWYRVGEASVDGTVLLFAMGVTLLTALMFGLAPALSVTRTDLSAALKEGRGAGSGMQSMRTRRVLVVFQVAVAAVLISGMGLAARSLLAMQHLDLGFEPDSVLTVTVTPPQLSYPDATDVHAFYERAMAELEASPGVKTVSTVDRLPLNNENSLTGYSDPAQVPAEREDWSVGLVNIVSPRYFEVMHVPILAGRDFTPADNADAPQVVIVSEQLARERWLGDDPIGRTIVLADDDQRTAATIIGVVGDVRFEGISADQRPQLYVPVAQQAVRRRFLVIAAHGAPGAAVSSVRSVLRSVDGDLPVTIRTMNSVVSEQTLPWSISSVLLALLGGASLLLAVLGLYGVVAYSVAQRHREIGVRMALGASATTIRRLFLNEGLKLSGIGLGLGLALALMASRAMASVLFGIGPFDPITFCGVVAVFVSVAALASVIPAMRASRVDAASVLRYE